MGVRFSAVWPILTRLGLLCFSPGCRSGLNLPPVSYSEKQPEGTAVSQDDDQTTTNTFQVSALSTFASIPLAKVYHMAKSQVKG